MKVLIDIPEEIYKASKIIDVQYEDVVQIPLEVIAKGTLIPDNATVCDIEQIRAEIMDAYDDNRAHDMGDVAYGIKIALQIMMEHMKGE